MLEHSILWQRAWLLFAREKRPKPFPTSWENQKSIPAKSHLVPHDHLMIWKPKSTKNFLTRILTRKLSKPKPKIFTGKILQQPPIFSALKKDGKRLYEYARKGESVDIPKREVHIETFEITSIDLPKLTFKVKCSKGTYIRSLAHDFGQALDSGAYLSGLRRTAIGDFTLDQALSLEQFIEALD